MSDEQPPTDTPSEGSNSEDVADAPQLPTKALSLTDAFQLRSSSSATDSPEPYFQCLPIGSQQLAVHRLGSEGPSRFSVETWTLSGDSDPTLQHTHSVLTKAPAPGSAPSNTITSAPLDEASRTIRIGTRFYRQDASGSFSTFDPVAQTSWSREPHCVGGVASRGEFLTLAGRKAVHRPVASREDGETFTYDSDEESEASSACSDDEAYESWSECSEDDSVKDYESDNSSIQEDESDQEEEEEETPEEEEQSDSSIDSDSSDGDSSDEEESEVDESLRPSRASLSVFTPKGRAFHYSRKLVAPLWDSPPIIHPTTPLVVWPLGESEILFGDYLNKTFYTRSAWTMGYCSRQLFVRARFSSCGKYLHVACLNGERTDGETSEPPLDAPMKLELSIYTHRLCDIKPSRCRPNLMHSTWITLGELERLNFDQPPCTLTWTDKDVYATLSDSTLRVLRIPLFSQHVEDDFPVQAWKPKELIGLPECARSRQVLYFPPAEGTTRATVVIAGALESKGERTEIDDTARVPLAFRLDEDKDFGGWVDYDPPETEEEPEETKEEEIVEGQGDKHDDGADKGKEESTEA